MKKQEVRTLFLVLLTVTCALMLSLSVVFALQKPTFAKAETPVAEVTGVQVRSGGGGYDFIVLQNSAYSSIAADTQVFGTEAYNTKSKVKIYTSAEQTEGTYLTSVCGTWWTQNLWGSGGLMLAIGNYDVYNGTTIYKITIEAGCELPCGDTVYKTTAEVSYFNNEHGSADVKTSAFSWLQHVKPTAPLEVTGVQVRSAGGTSNFIVLQNSAYASVSAGANVANTFMYNTKSKVKIYTSVEQTEGTYLTSICGTWWTQNLWNSSGLMLAIDNYDVYNGTTICKITIEAGCEIPCGDTAYITTEEITYYNKEYGNAGVKDSAFKWAEYVKPTAPLAVTGIQVRSAGGTSSFIVLQNSAYSSVSAGTDVEATYIYNTKDKVKIYTSAEQAEGTYLKDVCGTWWTQNMWSSGGLMLAVNNYDAYNGTTIYKITIEAGCELPCGDTAYVTTEEVSYVNKEHGQESVKNGAFGWVKYVTPVATTEVTGVQVRSGGGGYDFIVLQNPAYSSIAADAQVYNSEAYNTRSKVKIYTSAEQTEGTYLTSVCGTWWTQNLWGSGGLMLAVNDYNTYNGTTIYKITIEAGCELPCGDTAYVTAADITYYNGDYNDETAKTGATRWGTFDEVYKGVAYGKSISLEGEISVNFYVRLLDKNARAEFTENGVVTEVAYSDSVPVHFNNVDKEYRLFSYRVAAKDYDNDVKLTIIPAKDEVNSWSVTTSVKKYAEETLADASAEQQLKDLTQSLVNYCAAANAYFSEEPVADYGEVVDLSEYKPTGSGSQEGVTLLGATLVLESKTEIRVYFSGANAGTVECSVNGKKVAQKQEGDLYVIIIEYIAAQNLGDVQVIKIGGYTINYSALSYAYAVAENTAETDTGLINLVKYLYDYNVKAKLFF